MRTRPSCHRSIVAAVLAGAAFAAVAGSVAAATDAGAATTSIVITSTTNTTWGSMLTLGSGRALYRYADDSKDKSVCTGKCATAWPPVLVPKGDKLVGKGISDLGTITRSGGSKQVTYEGIPLYTFIGDKTRSAVAGNGKDTFGDWWVVNPAHPMAIPTKHSTGSSGTTLGSSTTAISY
jgi:predicted lipoprotein with Yx(FWY)xxD motif